MPISSDSLHGRAHRFVEDAVEMHTRQEVGRHAFGTLRDLIGFDTGIIVSLEDRSFESYGKSDRQLARWRSGLARFEPDLLRLRSVAQQHRRVFLDLTALAAGERDRMCLYADYLRPESVRSSIGCFLGSRDRYTHFVGLSTVGRGRLLGDDDCDVLRQLHAPLSLALHSRWGMEAQLPSAADLSAREAEICRLASRGLRNREIAEITGTSPHTVRNQLARIFRKLEVTTRAELAGMARFAMSPS